MRSIAVVGILPMIYMYGHRRHRVKSVNVYVYHPVPFDESRLNAIVSWVHHQHIRLRDGVYVLPHDMSSASATGRIYLTGGLLFVPTWVGRRWNGENTASDDGWLEGFVYSDKPVEAENGERARALNVPVPCEPWMARSDAGVCRRVMWFGVGIGTGRHWYPVDSFS